MKYQKIDREIVDAIQVPPQPTRDLDYVASWQKFFQQYAAWGLDYEETASGAIKLPGFGRGPSVANSGDYIVKDAFGAFVVSKDEFTLKFAPADQQVPRPPDYEPGVLYPKLWLEYNVETQSHEIWAEEIGRLGLDPLRRERTFTLAVQVPDSQLDDNIQSVFETLKKWSYVEIAEVSGVRLSRRVHYCFPNTTRVQYQIERVSTFLQLQAMEQQMRLLKIKAGL